MPSILLKSLKIQFEGLSDLLVPRGDIWSGTPLESEAIEGGRYLGKSSKLYLRVIESPVCDTCGFPLYGATDGGEHCQQCDHLDAVFESNRSVILLNRLGRRIVHELKYNNGRYLLPDIERIIQKSASDLSDRVRGCVLLPVPLHPRKLRERGFNQSLMLAKAFQRVLGDDTTRISEGLIRTRDIESQTTKDRSDRMKNVKGVFAVNRNFECSKDTPVTIIDDVFTTGSTINECAKVLKRKGYQTVRSLTFGHG